MSQAKFSKPVDPALYEGPDYDSIFHPHINVHASIADEAYKESQDWKVIGGGTSNSGLSNKNCGNWSALVFSECPPGKFRALALLWEFLVLMDGDFCSSRNQS